MSDAPISQWWKSHEPAKVSTSNAVRICFVTPPAKRAYCGRALHHAVTTVVSAVRCADCMAALTADRSSPDSGTRPDA